MRKLRTGLNEVNIYEQKKEKELSTDTGKTKLSKYGICKQR